VKHVVATTAPADGVTPTAALETVVSREGKASHCKLAIPSAAAANVQPVAAVVD